MRSQGPTHIGLKPFSIDCVPCRWKMPSIFDGTLPAVHSGWWWSVESTHTQALLHNNNKQLVSRWSDARPLREVTPYDAIRRRDAPSASAENNPTLGSDHHQMQTASNRREAKLIKRASTVVKLTRSHITLSRSRTMTRIRNEHRGHVDENPAVCHLAIRSAASCNSGMI
jgi:hypothetical protein